MPAVSMISALRIRHLSLGTVKWLFRHFDERGEDIMNRLVVGIFYRFDLMEDTHATRTLMSLAHDLAHRCHCSRAGSARVTSGTRARWGRLSGLWPLESARASPRSP